MDTRRRARYARIISQITRALDQEEIGVWLSGQWAEYALDPHSHPSNCKVELFIFADDAPDTRRLLEERGYAVVDISPTGFVAERGVCTALWELLWHDEAGRVVTYDHKDNPKVWPPDAFPREARGHLSEETLVRVVDPAAKPLASHMEKSFPRKPKSKGDLSKVKAIIHDRM